MKNTRQNVIKLLQKQIENAYKCADIYERLGDTEGSKELRQQAFDIKAVLWLLEDNNFFNEQWKVFNKESK